MIIHIL